MQGLQQNGCSSVLFVMIKYFGPVTPVEAPPGTWGYQVCVCGAMVFSVHWQLARAGTGGPFHTRGSAADDVLRRLRSAGYRDAPTHRGG